MNIEVNEPAISAAKYTSLFQCQSLWHCDANWLSFGIRAKFQLSECSLRAEGTGYVKGMLRSRGWLNDKHASGWHSVSWMCDQQQVAANRSIVSSLPPWIFPLPLPSSLLRRDIRYKKSSRSHLMIRLGQEAESVPNSLENLKHQLMRPLWRFLSLSTKQLKVTFLLFGVNCDGITRVDTATLSDSLLTQR